MTAVILRRIAKDKNAALIYLLYNLVLLLAAPLVLFYFLARIRRDKRYARGFSERLGRLPFSPELTPAAAVWLHAVSVGEIISAVELVRRLRQEYPAAPVYVSVTTVAGRALAEEKLRGLATGLFYAPIDYRWCVRRVLRRLRPALVVVLETEIWPNLYREVKASGASLCIVNGRISDRAFPRYRRGRALFKAALAWPDRILVQGEQDRIRYLAIGAPADRTSIGGNLKYDFQPPSGDLPEIRAFLERTAPREIWIAASTMPGATGDDIDEDDAIIGVFQALAAEYPQQLLILVPRRPERFEVAAAKLEKADVPFVRRSRLSDNTRVVLPGVLLVDTIGELSRIFPLADLVFMGGTLACRGGHNILEPAFCGKAVVVGPHMENFAEIAAEFRGSGAVVEVESAAHLSAAIGRLFRDPLAREQTGGAGLQLARSKRGVTERIVAELLDMYFDTLPCRSGRALLAPLAALWLRGAEWDRKRQMSRRRSLSTRVVSIGNITTGGAGKTPTAAWIAEQAKHLGLQPAILTRGYRRRSPEPSMIIPEGTSVPADVTGDEAQVYVRTGRMHVAIGADRYVTGRLAERVLHPGIFILDDAFQHWRLHRDLDIVLIDALDPFGGCELVPRGRLREPLDALRRAHVFVITRFEQGLHTDAIERRLRFYNARAPIFRSRVVPRQWVNAATGEAFAAGNAPFKSAGAFCGLGNPAGFWRTLANTRLAIPFRWEFGDHHVYRPREVRRIARRALAANAEALVTTEKDSMNLPAGFAALIGSLPLFYLEISVEMDNPEPFLALCLGNKPVW